MGLWVAQSFALEWRYSQDRRFLRERAYPFVTDLGRAISGLLRPTADGTLRLPLSTSPELYDNSMKAWLPSPSNFDLSLLHWVFETLDSMATTLGDHAAAAAANVAAGAGVAGAGRRDGARDAVGDRGPPPRVRRARQRLAGRATPAKNARDHGADRRGGAAGGAPDRAGRHGAGLGHKHLGPSRLADADHGHLRRDRFHDLSL